MIILDVIIRLDENIDLLLWGRAAWNGPFSKDIVSFAVSIFARTVTKIPAKIFIILVNFRELIFVIM
jgi:hypothetical protein